MSRTLALLALALLFVAGSVPAVHAGKQVRCEGLAAQAGTPGDDVIHGTPGDDVIHSLGGDDVVYGRGGDDFLCGGHGGDEIDGGGGRDVIRGGGGPDLLTGAEGPDELYGEDGHDTIKAGRGGDALFGLPGNDLLYGGPGPDGAEGGDGDDVMKGMGGGDQLYGLRGTDSADGGPGRDLCETEEKRACENHSGLLVVSMNLQEAFAADDVADPADVENFVERLLLQVPHAPDVVMLQEVVRASASGVADLLTAQPGYRYEVAVSPEATVFPYPDDARPDEVLRDTAIVINTGTVTASGPQGYVETSYAEEDGILGQRARTKEQAYTGITEIQSGTSYSVMSVHYLPTQKWFADKAVAREYKAQWSDQLASFLDETFPATSTPLLVGDFNNRRCRGRDETRDCEILPFWPMLTSTHSYTDAVFSTGAEAEIGTQKRIDYIFNRPGFHYAASDLEYTAEDRSDPATFYSDHRFLWAITASP